MTYAVTTDDFSWGGLAGEAGKGALIGGVAGLTGGARRSHYGRPRADGSIARRQPHRGVVAGGVEGAAAEAIYAAMDPCEDLTASGLVTSAGVGAFTPGASAPIAKRLADRIPDMGALGGRARSLSPDAIRFSQSSVNGAAKIEANMRANGWVGDAIDVVRMPDGGPTSIDNTRLLAAKRAGINVRADVHGFDDVILPELAGRFLSRKGAVPNTWARRSKNRINARNAGYPARHPTGRL